MIYTKVLLTGMAIIFEKLFGCISHKIVNFGA